MDVKIAIGIITYKRPKGLEIAINSLLKQKFKDHKKFKNQILKYWKEGSDEPFKIKDDYYNDKLEKSDWPLANNWDRPWIKYAAPSIHQHLKR